ncbi:MAG TPA: Rieske (2Fe-2S) protein [Stellaceae bacterium]|jgi:nitrite reductase/ring-hydroxylating ferredoxin subunit|nr:Rieske (2Fe-2S) protein [Stellaceae bacterium]
MATIALCKTDELRDGAVFCKRLSGVGEIAVTRLSDGSGYVAFEPRCPHALGPLAEAKRHGDVITCPWHFFRFDLKTGKPPGITSILTLRRYPVSVKDNEIFIETA